MISPDTYLAISCSPSLTYLLPLTSDARTRRQASRAISRARQTFMKRDAPKHLFLSKYRLWLLPPDLSREIPGKDISLCYSGAAIVTSLHVIITIILDIYYYYYHYYYNHPNKVKMRLWNCYPSARTACKNDPRTATALNR